MKALYIIGNGFDLAHGLKTSFSDFIQYFFNKVLDNPKRKISDHCFLHAAGFSDIINYTYYPHNRPSHNSYNETKKWIARSDLRWVTTGIYRIILSNEHLDRWADIEHLYFEELYALHSSLNAVTLVRKLNESLDDFSNHFQKYLAEIIEPNIGGSEIRKGPIQDRLRISSPSDTLYLNFNYTSTIERYDINPSRVVHIHGKLGESAIVLGYGDEHDPRFKELESKNENDLLSNNKSTFYSLNKGYRTLQYFMDDEGLEFKDIGPERVYETRFDVYIIGHSCGLSDKTLLSEIFDHKNLNSITIYYHEGQHRFIETHTNLSRHFTDKVRFRRMVNTFRTGYLIDSQNKLP